MLDTEAWYPAILFLPSYCSQFKCFNSTGTCFLWWSRSRSPTYSSTPTYPPLPTTWCREHVQLLLARTMNGARHPCLFCPNLFSVVRVAVDLGVWSNLYAVPYFGIFVSYYPQRSFSVKKSAHALEKMPQFFSKYVTFGPLPYSTGSLKVITLRECTGTVLYDWESDPPDPDRKKSG